MISVEDMDLLVFEPDNTSTSPTNADEQVPKERILNAPSTTRSAQDLIDTGTLTIDNDDGSLTDAITVGDRVIWRTQLEGESSLQAEWTGLVKDTEDVLDGPVTHRRELDLVDFVYGVANWRYYTGVFDNVSVDEIITTILQSKVAEVDIGQISSISTTQSHEFQRTPVLECLKRIRSQADIRYRQDGTALDVEAKGSVPSSFGLTLRTDVEGALRNPKMGDWLANDILVDGIREPALDVEQTSSDTYNTVTDSSREAQQVDVRKSRIAAIELDLQNNSSDDIIVRIHPDDGNGNPAKPSDTKADYTRARLAASDFSSGIVRFEFPEHDASLQNPHILAEADGSSGHGVGLDSSTGTLYYRIFYFYQTAVEASDGTSINEYRAKEGRYRRETVRGIDEGKQIAQGIVDDHNEPSSRLSFEAASARMHRAQPGDVLDVTLSRLNINEPYMITTKTDRYRSGTLESPITMRRLEEV
ncbi:hypothetical protein [Haloarcula pelagica]|uniref:hypothetical protein n=1 Tax=Haloarcula pelagica TaxID=3033389 RepID=UPI0024C43D6B|nr:hypothetical protein [Halomicroarcula sp. YJ-61-S]